VLAGGNSRVTAYFAPFPFYVERGEGCAIYDLDGIARVDFYNNATSLILGHCNPQVTTAVMAQATRGSAFANPTGPEMELATLLTSTIPLSASACVLPIVVQRCDAGHSCGTRVYRQTQNCKIEGGYHGTSDHVSIKRDEPGRECC